MRVHPTLAALAVAALLVACGDGQAGAPTAADLHADHTPEEHAEHGEHGDHGDHADHGDHGTEAEDVDPAPGSVTEATLARMLAMDPEHLASLHDHGDHDGHGREVAHPNGVDPVRVVIPAIGVDADVIELGLQDNGEMEVPSDFDQTGWFRHGPRPGRVGPAVIAGHVDDRDGPAVFYRLRELSAGDEIEVHGDAGEVVTFVVRALEQHAKDAFPTEQVYAGTPGPELRLITCAGDFDAGERSYRDNIIVFAERVDA